MLAMALSVTCCKAVKTGKVKLSGTAEPAFLVNVFTNWKDATRIFTPSPPPLSHGHTKRHFLSDLFFFRLFLLENVLRRLSITKKCSGILLTRLNGCVSEDKANNLVKFSLA